MIIVLCTMCNPGARALPPQFYLLHYGEGARAFPTFIGFITEGQLSTIVLIFK